MRLLFALILGSVLLSSCVMKKKEPVQPIDTNSLMHHVKVEEVIQTSSYTYLNVREDGQDYWMAVSRMDVEVGSNYYYESALEMKDFKSKELDRVFERILFVQEISDVPIDHSKMLSGAAEHSGRKSTEMAEDIQIEPASGGISIAELYKNRSQYTGKQVLVRGKVVKVNNNIMGRNWVHIQDGTNDSGNFDLTVITNDKVNVGDIATLEGTVSLDKDFGAGYFYELIVEGATLK